MSGSSFFSVYQKNDGQSNEFMTKHEQFLTFCNENIKNNYKKRIRCARGSVFGEFYLLCMAARRLYSLGVVPLASLKERLKLLSVVKPH